MTHSHAKTQPTSTADTLQQAISLAKAGQKIEARDVLRRVVALQPVNQAAWLWLSALATDKEEVEAALTQARHINPTHPSLNQAERWFVNRFSVQPPTKETPVANISTSSIPRSSQEDKNLPGFLNSIAFGIVVIAIVIGLIVLLLGLLLEIDVTAQFGRITNRQTSSTFQLDKLPQAQASALDTAWTRRDWTKAITILEEVYQSQPNIQGVADQLAHAYIQQGVALRHRGFIEEALPYFEQALQVTPDQLRAQQELRLASNYLIGAEHYQAGDWSEAITTLEIVRREDANYVNIKDLLYSAHYNHGLAQQAAGELSQARDAFEAAMSLRPDLSEPRLQLAELEFALAPQTPLATPVRSVMAENQTIVVSIAEQRMLVYEDNQEVFDFVVSTGEPGRDTAIGEFEILNKIDVAYASTWNLDMPYWMGIYWAGPLQNGIHSLPIVKHTGYKLWDGYLGQRVSYGCVILSDEDAATLYNWAEVGAKVKIVFSFDDWFLENELVQQKNDLPHE